MEHLLNAVTAIARQVSPEKAEAIAAKVRESAPDTALKILAGVVGTPAALVLIRQLVEAWRVKNISADEVAVMLLASSHVIRQEALEKSSELVWTGPSTTQGSSRRTEEALLQVIDAAKHTLFITSFVTYDIPRIVKALNCAADGGVSVSILLELSQSHGGKVSIDGIGKMRMAVPRAQLYVWSAQTAPFVGGSVHAKVAVADNRVCFITSANLTGYAMERNMEAGVMMTGGDIPVSLSAHLQALVDERVIQLV